VKKYILGLKNKLSHAIVGIRITFRTQSTFKILSVIAIVTLVLNILLKIEKADFLVWFIFLALMFGFEMINTAIEKICDFVQPELDPKIKIIKDISAGAVFIICLSFAIFIAVTYIMALLPLMI
jgi:diacylglycerol kinase (ATP)